MDEKPRRSRCREWALAATLAGAKGAYSVSLWFARQHQRLAQPRPQASTNQREPFRFGLNDLFVAMIGPAFLSWMIRDGWFTGRPQDDLVSAGIFVLCCVLACIALRMVDSLRNH
jgi:hypothetical protein